MALPDMNHILRYTQRMLWARGSIQFQLSGGIDSADGRMQSEVDRRTQRMRAGYFRLAGRVFENHRLSLKTRTQIFKAVVIPAALYGCATWGHTEQQIENMESTQYKLLKRMCRCGYRGQYDLSRISTAQVMQYIKEITGEEMVPIELLIHKMSMNYLKRTDSSKWIWLPREVAPGHLDHKGPGKHAQSLQYSDFVMKGIERLGIHNWYGRLGRTWEEGLYDHTTNGNDNWYTAVMSHMGRKYSGPTGARKAATNHVNGINTRRLARNGSPVTGPAQ